MSVLVYDRYKNLDSNESAVVISCSDALEELKAFDSCSVDTVISNVPGFLFTSRSTRSAIASYNDLLNSYLNYVAALGEELWRITKPRSVVWLAFQDILDSPAASFRNKASSELTKSSKKRNRTVLTRQLREPLSPPWAAATRLGAAGWDLDLDVARSAAVFYADSSATSLVSREYVFAFKRNMFKPKPKSYDGTAKLYQTSVFPRSMLFLALASSSQINDIVLDPFSSNGVVGSAAVSRGRRFIGLSDPDDAQVSAGAVASALSTVRFSF